MSHTRLAVASLIELPVSMTKVLLLQLLWRMAEHILGYVLARTMRALLSNLALVPSTI